MQKNSTPMHLAVVYGYEEVAQLLASKGARVDCKDAVSIEYDTNAIVTLP